MKSLILAAVACFSFNADAQSTYEYGWDRPGYDYSSFDLISPRFILCEWRCQNDAKCKAWTYVNPGVQGALARCWLKHKVPPLVKNNCCISGRM